MCNPPFYDSAEEMLASAKAKQRPPFSACTGAEVEMVTPGGEVAFVSRMIQESLHLRDRVEWYTSMLGKIASVSVVVEKLKGVGVSNWAVTEFVQGSKTRRWAVAWSWGHMRPRMVSALSCWESHGAGSTGLTSTPGRSSRYTKSSEASVAVPFRVRLQYWNSITRPRGTAHRRVYEESGHSMAMEACRDDRSWLC